jgi:peptidoglycan/xylan/chitin deacetylase (PgdA/CDA1 family)
MAGKIFINYRRDDSIGMAGRLHDRLAHTFGRAKLFMDVDHIPVGTDFVTHLNNQVAECDVILVVIGPNWLSAKDESGGRRLDDPDDFVAIEIAAALARDIRVIPVLVDGARMPKASELPDFLKPLARRHAVDVRHAHFGHDAEALVARMREALGDPAAGPRRWRVRAAIGAASVAVLLLFGWGGEAFIQHMLRTVEQAAQQREAELKAELERQARAMTEAEAKRKAEEAERQRLADAKAEQERQAKVAAEAEAKRKAEEAERQRLADAKAEQERQAKVAAEAEAKRKAEEAERQRLADAKAEQERQAKAAAAATECNNPNALGVSRKVQIDTEGGPGFGLLTFKFHDFLRDHEIVLTFDDGPWAENTPAVLKALADQCTKALFFPIGKHASYYPEIMKQVAAAGHTIGTHTWSHRDLSKLSEQEGKDEIEKGIAAISIALGNQPVGPFFRFPALQHPPEMVKYLGERNVGIFSTDIDSYDFNLKTPEEVIASVVKRLGTQGKGIILMHDFQQATAIAAPELLKKLKDSGYKVVQVVGKTSLAPLKKYTEMWNPPG